MTWAAALLAASLLAGHLPGWTSAASPCVDQYTEVFKSRKGTTIAPQEVADLYMTWCKKNMKVSSAKSMEDLCAPLVKKMAEKMRWVPPATDMTPEIACETAEKLQARFPEHVAVAQAQVASADKEDEAKKQLLQQAKTLKSKLEGEVKEVLGKWSKTMVQELGQSIRDKAKAVLGEDSPEAPREALAKVLEDTASLGSKGMETKLLQKLEEAVGAWVNQAAKEAASAKKSEL